MKIPISETLLDNTAEATVKVPLSDEEMQWVAQHAEAQDISKHQFVRYMINRLKKAEASLKNGDSS